jgi:hypothetical protein
MRRIQIHIEEDIDDALAAAAAREGSSKAALIRKWVAEKLQPLPRPEKDPVADLIGSVDCEPARVDDVVYGT